MGIAQRLTVVKQHDTEPAHHLRAGSRRTHGHPGYRTRRKRSGGAGFQQPSIPAKSPTMVLNPASLLLFVRMDKFFPRHGTPTARTAHACDFSRRAPLRISPPKKRGRAVPRHTYICMMPLPRTSRPHHPKAPRTASSRLQPSLPTPSLRRSSKSPPSPNSSRVVIIASPLPLASPTHPRLCRYQPRNTARPHGYATPLVILSQPNWWTIVTSLLVPPTSPMPRPTHAPAPGRLRLTH